MEIKYVTDKAGKKVLPITHVNAVRDDNGNPLPSIMGAFEDEVRGLVDTPHENFVTVAATSSTTAATSVLPASGQSADTIYRVSNWDGSANSGAGAYDVTKYSEYAWDDVSDPNKYIFLCTKSAIGEVFDITAYNSNTKYADLAAALGTNGANVPADIRRGGMSVKFVLSSDNKYIRYNLIADEFTTDTTQWAVDDSGVYVENPEFVYVKTDAEGKILWAIKADGSIYYGAGVPTQVKDYIQSKISELSLNEIVTFLGNLIEGDTLAMLLNRKVNVVEGKGLSTNDFTDAEKEVVNSISFVESSEWMNIETDAENKILSGRKNDGTLVEYCDVEYPNGIPNIVKSYVDNNPAKKTLKALFIGNSVSQDHITYLPWLLKNTYPELNFEIYIAYIGGITIKRYVEEVVTGNTALQIFSEAKNTAIWTNYNDSIYWDDIWDKATYDIISYEGYFNLLAEDTAYFSQFTNAVMAAQSSPFKFAYLMHQTYGKSPNSESVIWNAIVDGAEQALLTTPVDMLFPCGAVTKLLLNTWDLSFLTPDGTHNNEGLPCIMGAYVVMEKIANYLGLKSKVISNQLRITQEQYNTMNIPGPNGTLQVGTEEQYKQAQEAAISAVKWGDSLYNEICNSIIQ